MQTKYDYLSDRELEREVEHAIAQNKEGEFKALLQEMLNRFSKLI